MKTPLGKFSELSYDEFVSLAVDRYDFTTCQRSDGSYYGSRGRCIKGTEATLPKKEKKGKSGGGGLENTGKPMDWDGFESRMGYNPGKTQISSTAQEGIRAYTGPDYQKINKALRTGKSDPETQEKIDKMNQALKELPSNESGTSHFRGMTASPERLKALQQLRPGDTLTDQGFGSYTRAPIVVQEFAGGPRAVVIESRSTGLVNIENHSQKQMEREAVLPPGTSQTVREIRQTSDGLYILVD